MTDRVDQPTRSRVMASVRSKGARSTEQRFQDLLETAAIRGWQSNPAGIIGKPDFVFNGPKVAIFIDGCFWHGCQKHCRMPASNQDYWMKKVERNRVRDRQVNKLLRQEGWKVIRVWEHQLKESPTSVVKKIQKSIQSPNPK